MQNKYEELCLFPDYPLERQADKAKRKEKKRWEELRDKNFGLEYCATATFSGKYGIPLIKAYHGTIPEHYVSLNEASGNDCSNTCVTCFESDNELENLWYAPKNYVTALTRYCCFCEPDFSLKVKSPLSIQIANTYRNHAIAYYMQEHGVTILPSMGWSSTQSYEFCFDGHEKGGVVIVSTIGTLKDERSFMYFRLGFQEMLKRISPDSVILYGDCNIALKSIMPAQLDVHYYEHNRFKRMRSHGK